MSKLRISTILSYRTGHEMNTRGNGVILGFRIGEEMSVRGARDMAIPRSSISTLILYICPIVDGYMYTPARAEKSLLLVLPDIIVTACCSCVYSRAQCDCPLYYACSVV